MKNRMKRFQYFARHGCCLTTNSSHENRTIRTITVRIATIKPRRDWVDRSSESQKERLATYPHNRSEWRVWSVSTAESIVLYVCYPVHLWFLLLFQNLETECLMACFKDDDNTLLLRVDERSKPEIKPTWLCSPTAMTSIFPLPSITCEPRESLFEIRGGDPPCCYRRVEMDFDEHFWRSNRILPSMTIHRSSSRSIEWRGHQLEVDRRTWSDKHRRRQYLSVEPVHIDCFGSDWTSDRAQFYSVVHGIAFLSTNRWMPWRISQRRQQWRWLHSQSIPRWFLLR